MKNRSLSRRGASVILLGAVLLVNLAAVTCGLAQSTYTWTGGGSDANWSTGANWGGSAPANAYNFLHFAGTSNLNNTNNLGDYGPGYRIYFDANAGAFTLGGNAIKFYENGANAPLIENDSANTQTIAFRIGVTNPNGMDLKAVTGDLTLSAGNSIFFDVNNNNAPGGLRVDGGAGRTVTLNDALIDGSGAGSLTVGTATTSSTFTTILKGGNTYTGATTVNGGILAIGSGGSLYNGGNSAGSIAVNSGATLRFDHSDVFGNSSNTSAVVITVNGGTVASNNSLNVLRNANFNGGTLVSNGGIVGSAFGLGGTVTIGGTAATNFNVGTGADNNLMLGREGTTEVTTFNVGDVVTGSDLIDRNVLSNNFGATSGLTKGGAGTMELDANNSFTGATTITAGTLQLGGGGTAGNLSTSNVYIAAGAVLGFNRSDAPTFSNAINLYGTSGMSYLNVASDTSATLTGAFTSNGAEFWKTGAGTLVMSNTANAFTQSVVIAGGVLSTDTLSNGGSMSSLGAGGIFISSTGSGTLRYTGATATTDRIGAFALQSATLNGIEVATAGTTLTISSAIGETGTGRALTKLGAGTLTLTGAATYTGATNVNAGTLKLDSAGSTTARLGGTSGIVANTGGTLLLANSTPATASTDRINDAATVTLAGGALNLGGLSEGAAGTSGVGALTLTATSTLDFGTTGTGNLIQFAGLGTHTGGAALTVTDWEGTFGAPNGTDRLLFAGSAGAFTAAYGQGDVSFNGVAGYGVQNYSGFYEVYGLTAVPEPATVFAGAAMLGLAAWSARRRLAGLFPFQR